MRPNATQFPIYVDNSHRIRDIKLIIQQEEKIGIENFRLTFWNKGSLDDSDSLKGIWDSRSSIIAYHVRLRGGNMYFVNIQGQLIQRESNENARKWRTVKKGLTIEGICNNSSCEAQGQKVCCSRGFQSFDLKNDRPKCPLCNHIFKAIKPGFTHCWWRIAAFKTNGEAISKPWKKVKNHYETFDEIQSGMETYFSLIIEIKSLNSPTGIISGSNITVIASNFCTLCQQELEQDIEYLNCHCSFHRTCLNSQQRVTPGCPNHGIV